MNYPYSYLVGIQYLGFRFHGWQKQKNAMSLHEMIEKTLGFVLEDTKFTFHGASRTDSKVSARNYYFQLFCHESLEMEGFIKQFNKNAPLDIKALTMKEVPTNFNIIQAPKLKEYHYYFSFGSKNHPFAASLMVGFDDDLDIELMQQGAILFEGTHYFHKYCTQPTNHTVFKRNIESCRIEENQILKSNFFPEKSYVLKVKGAGFLRYQIRLMMGMLIDLGKQTVTIEQIIASLKEDNDREHLRHIAPGSGLQLYDITF